jgi:hypothetical protein
MARRRTYVKSYRGAPAKVARAQESARETGTHPSRCGPVKSLSREERLSLERELLARDARVRQGQG